MAIPSELKLALRECNVNRLKGCFSKKVYFGQTEEIRLLVSQKCPPRDQIVILLCLSHFLIKLEFIMNLYKIIKFLLKIFIFIYLVKISTFLESFDEKEHNELGLN